MGQRSSTSSQQHSETERKDICLSEVTIVLEEEEEVTIVLEEEEEVTIEE